MIRSISVSLVILLLAGCAKAPEASISVDEKKVLAWVATPKLFPDGISISPAGASLSKKQLLELNVFVLQVASVGAAEKEEVQIPRSADLFQAMDASMADFADWKKLKAEFSASSSVPASRVGAVVEHFAR